MSRETLILEQIFANELSKDAYTGKDLNQKLEQIELSNKEILKKYSTKKMEEEVKAKLDLSKTNKKIVVKKSKYVDFGKKSPKNITRTTFFVQRGIAVAAVLAVVLFIPLMLNKNKTAVDTVSSNFDFGNVANSGISLDESFGSERVKGSGSTFFVYKKAGDKVIRLKSGDKAYENDLIQLTYVSGGAKYGMIVSIDGNGVVTQHFPERGVFADLLSNEGEISLGSSYCLDDAPKFERFLFITSNKKFSVSGIEEAVASFKNKNQSKNEDFSKYLTFDVDIKDFILIK